MKLFSKNVVVTYQGVDFKVTVCCTPETSDDVLKRRAIEIIINAFRQNMISIAE
jgi:hypothetical protein